jgi:hypothetical protein
MRTKRFSEWIAEHDEMRARLNRLVAGLPKPYRRGRSRSEDEAKLLRGRDTPEHLIGPVESSHD